MHYRPRTAILNNLELDHADIFPDLAAIETQFHHLVRTVPSKGRLIVNAREESLARVLERGCWSEVQRFGARKDEPGTLRARGEPDAFDVLRGSLKIARVELSLLGEHNQDNALAAIAAAEHVGVGADAAARALASFENVRRRLELRGEAGGVKVYDDFAHHPTAGDGELQEGQIWEAAMLAAAKKLDNLISTVDWNGRQIGGDVDDVLPLGDLPAKSKAFGWKVLETEGNDMQALLAAMEEAKARTGRGKPVMVLMRTEMGQGVDFMMNSHAWHGIAPNDAQLAGALAQLPETLGDY